MAEGRMLKYKKAKIPMYSIADYDNRYRPYDKSGGELKNPEWVKMPCKPKGEGLQALFEYPRGLEIFGIWCLLLQKSTKEKRPKNRGKLLNHKELPASIPEIAKSISLPRQIRLVDKAISALVEMGWITLDGEIEVTSDELPQTSAKSKVLKSSVEKSKHLDFVLLTSEEYKKLLSRYGDINTRKLIDALNRYIGSTGKQYKSHYYTLLNFAKRDDVPELKPHKEDAAAEQKALERKRREIRKDEVDYYREKTTDELRAMLNEKKHLSRRWLIDEILQSR